MAKRTLAVIAATWAGLIFLFAAPAALPETWQYRIYSPASVLLWMLSMLAGPFVACTLTRDWIARGARRG